MEKSSYSRLQPLLTTATTGCYTITVSHLTGAEASTLSYLARYPKAKDALALARGLSGDARSIALAIIGREEATGERRTVAEGYRDWARELRAASLKKASQRPSR